MKASLLLPLLYASLAFAGDLTLGRGLTLSETTPLKTLAEKPEPYLGKMVQVKGRVTAVCEMMGCWMNLEDPESRSSLRVKVADGEIVFPKNSVGKMATAEGKLQKLELTHQQAVARAKHEAEEQGRPFRPDLVKGPVTIYQLQGTGAVIAE